MILKNFFIRRANFKTEDYNNKNYIIFGGATGYGFEIAKYIYNNNGNIILISRNKNKLKKAKNKIVIKSNSNKLIIKELDIKNLKKLRKTYKEIKVNFDKIDAVIQCIAIPEKLKKFPIINSKEKYLFDLININFYVNIFIFKYFINVWTSNKKTKFIFFTSKAAWSNTLNFGLYNISKSALNSFVFSASNEIKESKNFNKIEIICLEPGEAKTEMNKKSEFHPSIILNSIKKILFSNENLNGIFLNRFFQKQKFLK